MFDIFSTREIATGIWIIVVVVIIFARAKTRDSAIDLIKAATTKKLLIPFVIMILYAVAVTYGFSLTSIWRGIYVKEIAIWTLFAGIPVCFGAVNCTIGKHYFRKIFFNNLKFIILVEFFITSFTFHIAVELVLLPVVAFIVMLQAFSENKEENKSVNKLFTGLLVIIGIIVIVFTIKKAIKAYSVIDTTQMFVSFSIPIVLSILYLPVAYFFALYAKYEMVFIRMSFKEPDDKKLKRSHRRSVIRACRFSYSKIYAFEKDWIKKMYKTMSEKEFYNMIEEFTVIYYE